MVGPGALLRDAVSGFGQSEIAFKISHASCLQVEQDFGKIEALDFGEVQ